MQADVGSVDTIDQLRIAVLELARRLGDVSFETRGEAERALQWAHAEAPRYWNDRLALAQRKLQEALDNLATQQSTYGGRDKPPATEAKQRIARLRQRVRYCQQKLVACKGWGIEVERAVDQLAASTSGLQQHSETDLPTAAGKLARWIAALVRYTGSVAASSKATTAKESDNPSNQLSQDSGEDRP